MPEAKPGRREWLLLMGNLLSLIALRYSGMAAHPYCRYAGHLLTALFFALALGKKPSCFTALLFSVAVPFLAWLIDLTDGDMAFVYGTASFVAMLLMMWLGGKNPAVLALCGALCAAAVITLGEFALLAVKKVLTPGAAMLYALPRHILPALSYFVGLLAGLTVWRR